MNLSVESDYEVSDASTHLERIPQSNKICNHNEYFEINSNHLIELDTISNDINNFDDLILKIEKALSNEALNLSNTYEFQNSEDSPKFIQTKRFHKEKNKVFSSDELKKNVESLEKKVGKLNSKLVFITRMKGIKKLVD